ncbi:MAG: DNA repair protein RadA, partial [Defluviitaleaceae bacterium]|nr:DNA repair protein RadA [Defluviitaleaceae bacterium]
KLTEPAADLAAIAAIAASCKNLAADPHMLIFGEAGLTGEVRAVANAQRRIDEGAKLGFNAAIVPRANLKGLKQPDGMKIYGVGSVGELLDLIFVKE